MLKFLSIHAKRFLWVLVCWLLLIGALYYLVEKFLFWPLTALMPASTQWALGDTGYPLLQYSKKKLVPEDYIVITGDSYALGVGSWLYREIKQHRPDYHAGHILHKLSSRDVITLGQPGDGSIRGIAIRPSAFIEKIHNKYRIQLKEPTVIIAYFYEGNDIHNNVNNIHHVLDRILPADYDMSRVYDSDYFQEFIHSQVVADQKAFMNAPFNSGFVLADFFVSIMRMSPYLSNPHIIYGPDTPGTINAALQNGTVIPIPDGLEPMGLQLTEDEFKLGVYVFEQSIKYLVTHFPNSKIGVVYIPSPLSSYTLASSTVSINVEGDRMSYPAANVRALSNRTCSAIHHITQSYHLGFIDLRPRIRKITETRDVLSANDWNHFNQEGYTALGEASNALLQQLTSGASPTSCAAL